MYTLGDLLKSLNDNIFVMIVKYLFMMVGAFGFYFLAVVIAIPIMAAGFWCIAQVFIFFIKIIEWIS